MGDMADYTIEQGDMQIFDILFDDVPRRKREPTMFQRVKKALVGAKERLGLRWQNLYVPPKPGDRWCDASGSLLRHGRAWLKPWGWDNLGFRLEWSLGSGFTSLDFTVDPTEGEVSGGAAIPPIALWWAITDIRDVLKSLGLDGPWEEPGGLTAYQKDVRLSFHDGTIFWVVWYDDGHWSCKMPRWRHGSFDVVQAFLGDTAYAAEVIQGPVEVEFPMPERSYKGTVTLKRETWKRPRLPWNSTQIVRAHMDTDDDPIPHPGKGTTSYNCGEDATRGLTCEARTIGEAIGKMVGCVMRSRERHGGLDWRPEKDHRRSA